MCTSSEYLPDLEYIGKTIDHLLKEKYFDKFVPLVY